MKNASSAPFFSVIVPVYNREKLILPTLKSVFEQNFTDFELIVVDDGSTDRTGERIRENFGDRPELRYFFKENGERSAARNFGLQKADGQFAVFLDSDDRFYPQHLAVLQRAINENPGTGFFAAKYVLTDGKKSEAGGTGAWPGGFYDDSFLLKGNPLAMLICLKIKPLPTFLFPEDFRICEDWVFHYGQLRGKKMYLIDEVTAELKIHPGRTMNNNREVIVARLAATSRLRELFDFSAKEQQLLDGFSARFAAVHAYLENDFSEAFKHWKNARRRLGLSADLPVLLLKIWVGKKRIQSIRRFLGR